MAGSNFHSRQTGLKFALFLLGAKEADIPFFVNRNEFIVQYCLRQYLGLAARCHRHDFLPMMNNLFVKFRKMAIKIKKVKCKLKIEKFTDVCITVIQTFVNFSIFDLHFLS